MMSRKAMQMGEEWRTKKVGGEVSSEERFGGWACWGGVEEEGEIGAG
jgi:hypothetical protein